MGLRAKIILIFSVVFVIGGGIVALFAYQASLSKGLNLELKVPENVQIGVPFDFQVNISNSSANILEDVRLSVNLPEGLAFLGSLASKNVDFRSLNNLGQGSLTQQTFRLIALNGENTFKRIIAGANYLTGSLSSRFQKEESVDLAVGAYGIALDIATPQKIFSGENFDTEIAYKNVSGGDFNDLKLKIDYPITFTLVKSSLAPDLGNNVWVLGGLRKGSEMKFKINGNVIGPEGSSFDIKSTIQTSFLGQTYDISVNTATIAIATSPLSLKISLNGETDYVSKADDSVVYSLTYLNNTDIALRDVVVKAQLIGAMFDFSTLQSPAAFRSTDNTLIWNASNAPQLATISAGQSGSVSFTIKTKSVYPIKRLSDRSFTLKVAASIESPTVPNFVSAEKTFSVTSLESKVSGQAVIDTKAYFRDATSGILNKGPFPPKVNQPTQYTVHWLITNQATDIKDVEVKAFLGGNVRYVGVSKVTGGSDPVYNERTQEMIWKIDRIPATTGVISRPLEVIFQIEATPSTSDKGRLMPLIGETTLRAIDEFTGIELFAKDIAITTGLPDDPTAVNQGVVQQ